MERTLNAQEKAYKNMVAVAKMLEAVSKNGYEYEVKDCYFDRGVDWMWTTIICYNPNATGMLSSWQVLCPRDWREIVFAETTDGLANIVATIRSDKYFRD